MAREWLPPGQPRARALEGGLRLKRRAGHHSAAPPSPGLPAAPRSNPYTWLPCNSGDQRQLWLISGTVQLASIKSRTGNCLAVWDSSNGIKPFGWTCAQGERLFTQPTGAYVC